MFKVWNEKEFNYVLLLFSNCVDCCCVLFMNAVNLEIKDGRIIAAHKIELPQPLNETHFDLTILALATPPNGSIPQILTLNNKTEAQPVSSTE